MNLIEEIRRRNPSLAEADDSEIKSLLRQSPEFQGLRPQEFEAMVGGSPEPTPDTDRNSETVGGLFGDAIDAVQMGAYQVAQGAGDFAYEYTGVGRGLGDFGREGAARQIEEMSPRSAEAIQQQIFESTGSGLWDFELGEGANPLTIFLQTASLAGEAVTTGVGAGSLARGVTSFAGRSVGNAARRRAADVGLDEAGQAAAAQRAARDFAASRTADGIKLGTYGAAETAINTGQIADGAAQEVLGMSDEELDRSEAFAELYWELAEANPEASVSELRQAAREQMASGAKSLVMRDPALLLTTAVLGGYGGKALDDLVTKGTGVGGGRLGAAVRQAAVQGVAETGQGGVGQYAINQGVAEIGADPSRDPMEGVAAAGLSEGFVGGVMGAGAGGLAGRPRKPRAQDQIEAAREQAAAQGGDSLDQAQAAQAAEQAIEPEPVDPAATSDLGNRLQMALGGLDELQSLARGSEFEGQARLRNVNRLLDNAEQAFENSEYERAERLLQRADGIAADLRTNLQRAGSRERPMTGDLVEHEAPQQLAGYLGQDFRRLPPGDPSTIYAEGPTADRTQYDPQARNVRRDERMAAQRQGEASLRERAAQPRPQLADSGILYGPGPVAGNANTGLDQPFADPRFSDTRAVGDIAPAREPSEAEPRIAYRANGQPFASERSAMMSGVARRAQAQGQHAEAVPVEGGFAVRVQEAAQDASANAGSQETLFSLRSVVRGDGQETGMPVAQAQRIAEDFLADYNGNVPLDLHVVNRQEEAYGPENTRERIGAIKGAYHPGSGKLILAAANLRDAQDGRRTLRHEVVGHYGLNTFRPEVKRAILDRILETQDVPSLGPAWRHVNENYPADSTPRDIRAEEVFAFAAEQERGRLGAAWDRVLAQLNRALRQTGLTRHPLSRSELQDLANTISREIREGRRQQQTFPSRDQDQFRREETPPAPRRDEAGDGAPLAAPEQGANQAPEAPADVAMAGGQQDLMGTQPGAEAEPAPAESARDAAESPDDSAPKPKRRNKPLSYTGYSGEERQVRSYQEVGDYRIAKVHDGLYEVIDGRDQAISQMAGPNGAAREARRLSDLPTDQRYAIGRSDARPVSREAIIEAIGDTPELSDAKVIQSALELPPQALIGMVLQSVDPRDVRGMYIDGDLYVVADNVESVEDGVRAAIHEAVGHKGIRGVLGDQGHQLDRVMLSLYRSLPNHPTGRDILAEVRRDYPFLDPANREDRITIGEELVAHLLEKGYRPKAWHRAVAKIRDLLRRVFPSIGWTYTDVLALGEQSREWLRREKAMRDAEQAEPVVTRYSKRKGENQLFTPIRQEAEAYREDLENALKGRVGRTRRNISLGRTPPVLASLGAPDLDVTIGVDVVHKAVNNKHSVPMEVVEQLPELLHDPAMVLESATQPNAMLVVLQAADPQGRPVLVPLHLDKRQKHIRVNRIASAYGKDRAENFLTRQIREGRLRYLQTKRGPEWLQSLRLQLPVEGVNRGPNSSVLTPEDIGNPEIRFALRGKPRVAFESQFDDFTDADRAAASKIGDPTISRSIHQWWQEKTDRWRAKIRQGAVDQYGPLMEQDLALYGDEALTEQITQSAWVKARMAKSANGVAEVLLKNSRIEWNAKEQVFQPKDDDSKGLGAVLGQLGDAAEIHRFLGWIAGNRADKLRAEGRENLFKDADIDAMKSWNRGNLADGRNRDQAYREVFKEFQQYRDDVLAAGEALGVISPEQRAAWRDEFYVPFYRLSEEKGFEAGQLATGGLTRQQAVKKLKGGTGNLNNLLENTMMNFHHIIDAGLKNNAAKQAIENSKRLGVARRVPESHPSATKTFIMEDGKKVFYEIDDPLVYNAVTALVQTGMNSSLMKLMRGFKRVFTNTVTVTPQYIGANLLRDSIQAPATSDLSKNLLGNILVGHRTLKDQKVRAQMLAAGASFSFGHLYGTANTDEVRAGMNRSLRDAKARGVPGSGLPMGAGHVASVVRWGWSKWNDVNNHAENLNRAAIYAQNAKEGQQLRAAFEARDLMDFSSHGAWPAVRVLIDIVPFLNARIQGLDKIYRSGVKPGGSVLIDALRGKTPNATDKQLAGRFWAVTGAVSLAMLALYLENRDEEWYRELEEWERDTYTHFNIGNRHFKIPNPFEVGAIGTMMIRTAEQFLDDQATGALFRQRLWHMVTDTFAVGMPQIMQPALDVYANKDSFTGRPIESMSMRNLSPELRQRYGTSAIGSGVSQLLNATLGAIGDPESNPLALSPVQVDHLVQGYLGQVGAWALGMGDTFWRFAQGHEAPDRKWYEFQPFRRFYSNLGDTDPYTRYGTVFYEGLTEARRAYSDVKELREMGRFEAAQERRSEGQRLLALRRGMNRAQRQLGQLNRQITIIQRSNLSGALKRQRIERLQARKTQIQRIWGERVLEARATGT
ncbi:LPD38 domain-containing protein [Bisbaumannia pacifica]|uniref:Phage MuF C-terminal domain-containing protein n=1 Tax=Bisbaumannia pacifica TaxID=77098 RepID=A0ABD4KY89_9GAMM|nr:LPD38 domain-containing protein [Halomonas pacifica]MBH8578802.1 hypothetical protein [Halomonas pacifica]